MEDDDHPEDTEEEVWGWKPVYEFRWFPPGRDIVAWDPVFLGTREVHTDHEYTIIWDPTVTRKEQIGHIGSAANNGIPLV